jgi:DNA-binding NarL/FixJ family response regulator
VSDPIRVLLADHDASSRAGVRLSLAEQGFAICGEADTADAAVVAARRDRPDVCLIEADLPGGGIEALQTVLAEVPDTVVVMLSASVDDERLLAAVRAGARGYLLKDMDPASLPMALRGVLGGEAALPRALVGRVLEELRAIEHGRHSDQLTRLGVCLTQRERQVLELLERGLGTSEIGQILAISSVTVRRHVSEVLRKLDVPDRESALGVARGAGGQLGPY